MILGFGEASFAGEWCCYLDLPLRAASSVFLSFLLLVIGPLLSRNCTIHHRRHRTATSAFTVDLHLLHGHAGWHSPWLHLFGLGHHVVQVSMHTLPVFLLLFFFLVSRLFACFFLFRLFFLLFLEHLFSLEIVYF